MNLESLSNGKLFNVKIWVSLAPQAEGSWMQIKIKHGSGELVRIFCFRVSTEVSWRAGAAIRGL